MNATTFSRRAMRQMVVGIVVIAFDRYLEEHHGQFGFARQIFEETDFQFGSTLPQAKSSGGKIMTPSTGKFSRSRIRLTASSVDCGAMVAI